MVGRRLSPGPRDHMRPLPPRDGRMPPPRDPHQMAPSRDGRPLPPMRDGPGYPPPYQERERMKRDFRKPSPDMRRPRSRSMSPPQKKRHPPPPPPHADGYGVMGAASPPPMRRRRSYSPPPPPPSARGERSRSPQRKQRVVSPPPAGAPRGSRASSPPRASHGSHGSHSSHHGHRGGSDAREPHRSRPPPADGQPEEFYGPWGTRITIYDLKKITVDIKRTVPKNKRSSSPIIRRIINADDITLYRRNGEGSRPLLDRPELQSAVNRRFDDAPGGPQEPRVVAIIREPSHSSGNRREDHSFERRSASRERGFMPDMPQSASVPVGERIDRDRSERTQRQVAKLEQMEVAIDRKLEQIQRYERKYEETLRDELCGDGKDDRKPLDRSVRDRLGPKRNRSASKSPERDREFDGRHRERLPDFSQRPNKPPIWGDDGPSMRQSYYGHENRENGYRGRGRGGFRARGRGGPRGRGRFSPQSWQHDKYEAY